MDIYSIARMDIPIPGPLEEFVDRLHNLDFRFDTGILAAAGMETEEINHSINRSIHVCRMNGIDSSLHFRSYYVFDEKQGDICCDWRMTREGLILAIINAPVYHPGIARWQWELANNVWKA